MLAYNVDSTMNIDYGLTRFKFHLTFMCIIKFQFIEDYQYINLYPDLKIKLINQLFENIKIF